MGAAGDAQQRRRVQQVRAHLPAADLPDVRGGAHRELVQAVLTAEDEGAGAARGEHAGDGRRDGRIGDPYGARERPRGVRDRSQDVHHGGDAQALARLGGEAHGGMEHLREEEGHADLADQALDLGHGEVQTDAERLEHVGRARARGRGAVAVLDDGAAGRGDHDRGHRGDVHSLREVAPGADDVDRMPLHRDGTGMGDHRIGQGLELRAADALGLERHEEARQGNGTRLSGHDLVHRPARLGVLEMLAAHQARGEPGPGRGLLAHASIIAPASGCTVTLVTDRITERSRRTYMADHLGVSTRVLVRDRPSGGLCWHGPPGAQAPRCARSS